jgi:hypothetical protein
MPSATARVEIPDSPLAGRNDITPRAMASCSVARLLELEYYPPPLPPLSRVTDKACTSRAISVRSLAPFRRHREGWACRKKLGPTLYIASRTVGLRCRWRSHAPGAVRGPETAGHARRLRCRMAGVGCTVAKAPGRARRRGWSGCGGRRRGMGATRRKTGGSCGISESWQPRRGADPQIKGCPLRFARHVRLHRWDGN